MKKIIIAIAALWLVTASTAAASPADIAETYVGMHEGTARANKLTGVNTRKVRWCMAFVRAVFDRAGRHPTKSIAVAGWDSPKLGPVVKVPQRGDVAFWHHSHGGIVVSYYRGTVCTVSANRSDEVKRSCEPISRFRHFRRVR